MSSGTVGQVLPAATLRASSPAQGLCGSDVPDPTGRKWDTSTGRLQGALCKSNLCVLSVRAPLFQSLLCVFSMLGLRPLKPGTELLTELLCPALPILALIPGAGPQEMNGATCIPGHHGAGGSWA